MARSEELHESPAKLAHYLQGIKLPANKAALKTEAHKNKVPREMMKLIDALPEQSYQTMPDIMKAVGQVEHKMH
jgi:Protein of unknown function (DUF2795)